jgi:hypothetical protein
MLPWLIYAMLMVIGWALVSVLRVLLIAIDTSHVEYNWFLVVIEASACLAISGIFYSIPQWGRSVD